MRSERLHKLLGVLPIAVIAGVSQYAQERGWVREWQVLVALCALAVVGWLVGMVVEKVLRSRGRNATD
jgi:uncharacterized membrane protein YfcA